MPELSDEKPLPSLAEPEKTRELSWDAVWRYVWIPIMVVVIITLCMSWSASSKEAERSKELKGYVQCQADWTNFLFNALQASRTANAEAALALDNLIDSISTSKSEADTRAALATYKLARDKQKDTQTKNPLPPPPNTICKLEEK